MKGNDKIIAKLNDLLADELTAINQYMVHSEMCDNWGYTRLHEVTEKRAIDEMKHAEKLIARILYLEGLPIVSELKSIHIGANVEKQLDNDWEAEAGAVKSYNDGIKLCVQFADNGTRELLEAILKDEEAHIDLLEAQKDQVAQMGIKNYLAEQIRG
ncbi:MAG TPA: bacterioferritin [Acidobacteriota bacterium]|nr:bacterioferritin [Acidobacteriota bacterium]HQG93013.1 bacterioferritin [Acidobacteriota bacterium]HQK88344.1 bacterioferritin [Acidobacteriota bacterium]